MCCLLFELFDQPQVKGSGERSPSPDLVLNLMQLLPGKRVLCFSEAPSSSTGMDKVELERLGREGQPAPPPDRKWKGDERCLGVCGGFP